VGRGKNVFERHTKIFYDKVLKGDLLYPVFKNISEEHSKTSRTFIAEVFCGCIEGSQIPTYRICP
jgi:hemoglobin